MAGDDNKLKLKTRRVKANGRERARMHGLNHALDLLRQYVPLTTQHQKLSKIETLRLARNYIAALNRMLQTGCQPTPLEYAHQLSVGLSQTTTNMLANLLQVQPRLLLSPSGEHCPSSYGQPMMNNQMVPAIHCEVSPQYYEQASCSDSSFETSPQMTYGNMMPSYPAYYPPTTQHSL